MTQRPHRVFAPLLVWCGTAHGVSVVSYQLRAGTAACSEVFVFGALFGRILFVCILHVRPLRIMLTGTFRQRPYCRQSTKRASLGKAHVENDIKRSLEPVLTAYEKVGASKYAAEVSSILVCCRGRVTLTSICCGWHTLL